MRALLRQHVDQFALNLSFIWRQVTVKLVQGPLHVICLAEGVDHIELLPIGVVRSTVHWETTFVHAAWRFLFYCLDW